MVLPFTSIVLSEIETSTDPGNSNDNPPDIQTVPQGAPDKIVFTFSKDDIYNTIITSDDVIYEVVTSRSKLNLLTTISRIDRITDEKRIAGEISYKPFQGTLVRVGWAGIEWMKMSDWLTNEKSRPWSTARSFIGANGAKYRWKFRRNRFHLTIHDDPADPDESQPSLASFHPGQRNLLQANGQAYLEVSHSVLPSLDHIIVSFLYQEKRRRDQ